MLPITGYVDRWSVRPGEEINFMIGVRGGGRYRARIARVICGDPNPQGPGYREIPVSWALEGEHDGEEQLVAKAPGSIFPCSIWAPANGPIVFAATIWPTLIAADRQAVLSWRGGDAALTLGIGAKESSAGSPRPRASSMSTSASPSPSAPGTISPACSIQPLGRCNWLRRRARPGSIAASAPRKRPAKSVRLSGAGAAAVAAEHSGDGAHLHFNGKIERPRIVAGVGGIVCGARDATHRRRDTQRDHHCRWDLSIGIPTDMAADIGPAKAHGRCVNLPTRAMTGSR